MASVRGRFALGLVALIACATPFAACSSDSASSDGATTTTAADSEPVDNTKTADPAADGSTTTAAPADGPATGNIEETAPVGTPAGMLEPVALDEVADFGNGVTARITELKSVQAEAELPGEIAGPAVQVKVEIQNSTDAPIDLGNVAVVLTTASGLPATLITNPTIPTFEGSVDAGDTASGSYIFTIAPTDRADAQLTVKYSAETPLALFTGSLPNG